MRIWVLLFCLVGLSDLCRAAAIPVDDAKKLKVLATQKLSEDFRIVFHEEKNVNICGGQGNAYIGQVQVNNYSRGYNDKGSHISDNWTNIDTPGRYAIFKQDLKDPNPKLFDNQQCME